MALSKDDLILNTPFNEFSFEINAIAKKTEPILAPKDKDSNFSEKVTVDVSYMITGEGFAALLNSIENNPNLKEVKIIFSMGTTPWNDEKLQALFNSIQKSKVTLLSFITPVPYWSSFNITPKDRFLEMLSHLLENSNITTFYFGIPIFGILPITKNTFQFENLKRLCEAIANSPLKTLDLTQAICTNYIDFDSYSGLELNYLWQALTLSHISALDLSGFDILKLEEKEFHEFLYYLAKMPFKEIKFAWGTKPWVVDAALLKKLEALFAALSQPSCRIESLQLGPIVWNKPEVFELLSKYLKTKKLKHISLNSCPMKRCFPSPENIIAWFQCCKDSALESLDLSWTNLQSLPNEMLKTLGSCIADSSFTKLNLAGNSFSFNAQGTFFGIGCSRMLLELIKPLEKSALNSLELPISDVINQTVLEYTDNSPLVKQRDATRALIQQLAKLPVQSLKVGVHDFYKKLSVVAVRNNPAIPYFMHHFVNTTLLELTIEGYESISEKIHKSEYKKALEPELLIKFPLKFNQDKVRKELNYLLEFNMPQGCMGLILNYYHGCFDTKTARVHALTVGNERDKEKTKEGMEGEDDFDVEILERPKKRIRLE